MKVDVKKLHQLIEKRQGIELEIDELAGDRMFCDICGNRNPPSLFYPMEIGGPQSVSGFICNDCVKAMRTNSDQEEKETG